MSQPLPCGVEAPVPILFLAALRARETAQLAVEYLVTWRFAVRVVSTLSRGHDPAQFAQGLLLNLPHTLTRQPEPIANLPQGLWAFPVQAKTQPEHCRFASSYLVEQGHNLVQVFLRDTPGLRCLQTVVNNRLDEWATSVVVIGLGRGVADADRLPDNCELLLGELQSRSDFFVCRDPVQFNL